MNHPVTKLLMATPPAGLAAGFIIRMAISNRPPITIVRALQAFSWIWAIMFVGLCVVAVILSYIEDREWSILLRAVNNAGLSVWAFLITLGIFFREDDLQSGLFSSMWWHTRDYTSSAAAFAVATFFAARWWDQVHFRLRQYRSLLDLKATLIEAGEGHDH